MAGDEGGGVAGKVYCSCGNIRLFPDAPKGNSLAQRRIEDLIVQLEGVDGCPDKGRGNGIDRNSILAPLAGELLGVHIDRPFAGAVGNIVF